MLDIDLSLFWQCMLHLINIQPPFTAVSQPRPPNIPLLLAIYHSGGTVWQMQTNAGMCSVGKYWDLLCLHFGHGWCVVPAFE